MKKTLSTVLLIILPVTLFLSSTVFGHWPPTTSFRGLVGTVEEITVQSAILTWVFVDVGNNSYPFYCFDPLAPGIKKICDDLLIGSTVVVSGSFQVGQSTSGYWADFFVLKIKEVK